MVLTGRHAGSGLPTNNAGGEYQRNRSRTQDPNHSPLAVASRHRFIVRADARRLASSAPTWQAVCPAQAWSKQSAVSGKSFRCQRRQLTQPLDLGVLPMANLREPPQFALRIARASTGWCTA